MHRDYDAMRPQPLICVSDVEASSRWYQHVLGCESDHGGPNYERLVRPGTRGQPAPPATAAASANLILQLHAFDVHHHHGPIGDVDDKPYGNGVLLWFEVDDIDAAIARAMEVKARIVKPRHRNPPPPAPPDGGPAHWECWLLDPDGYKVVLASPDGSAR